MLSIPAHKQTDPAKKPGQIINPINTDMMDEMSKYAAQERHAGMRPELAATYKPTHGGYPGTPLCDGCPVPGVCTRDGQCANKALEG